MIHINIGSNLNSKFGDRFKNILLAINLLINSHISIKKFSSFYETPSYPDKNLPKFINIGINIEYKFDYLELMKITKLIEKKLGRINTKKNNPRVCDIDIIDFKSKIIKSKIIELPHPRCHLRNFVLYPIKEVAPKWKHPIFNKNIDFLLNDLSQPSRIEITRLSKSVII